MQLALSEINDKDVQIIPRDSGSNDKEKLNLAVQEIKSEGASVVIGPINNDDFKEVKKYSDMVFISLSNKSPEIQNNIISIGISLESQMYSLIEFIKKRKKKKTVILIPKNQYTEFIDKKLNKLDLKIIKFLNIAQTQKS